jgi:hypothetical protein
MKTHSLLKFPTRMAFLGFFILMAFFGMAQQGEPYYVKSLDGLSIKEAELLTSGGSLQIYSISGEKHRLEVYIRGNNNNNLSKAEIEERLKERYELTIEASSDKIKAIAKQKSGWTDWKNALSISFKLYVPSNINSKLKTSGGSITLKGLDGKHEFATSGGSLSIEGLKGDIDGKTSGGSITVKDSEGTIDLKTSGGSISASGCKGEIDLATSGGSLKLDNLSGKIEATTSGGSVSGQTINGDLITKTSGGSVRLLQLKGSVEASTSGGSMTVDILELGSYVKLKTSAGNIDLNIPKGKGVSLDLSGNKVNVPSLTNFSGSASDDDLTGTLNGGGIPVSARASAGKVNLKFN